jgi:DHA2 family multidrug resistance protein
MGLIVTLAPTVGPTLGGHLTEWANWRWLFFINAPIGLLVLFGVWRWGDFDKGDPSLAKGFDWIGLGVMATFLMSMQYVLEEGSKNDWFQDDAILGLTVVAVTTGVAFVWRSLTYRQPIVELRAFGNRNFMVGVTMTFITGAALFGGTFLLPLFLGRIRGFSASQVGTAMAVSGVSMFLAGPIAGRLARKLDPRILMCGGFALVAGGMWQAHEVNTQWGFWEFASVQALRGVGVMIAMIASQQVTMSTLPPQMVKNASGLVNLSRNVGGAVGLAVLNTSLTTRTAAHLQELANALDPTRYGAYGMLSGLIERMQSLGAIDPEGAGRKAFFGMLQKQATTMAFGDAFALVAAAASVASIAALFARPAKAPAAPPADLH